MNNILSKNRWYIVIGAILIQLALGAIYSWSVFTKLLTDQSGDYRFTATEAAWIFSTGLATFAIVMIMAGKWLAKVGPRIIVLIGGVLLGSGYILGGFLGNSYINQLIFIGFIGGAGIGFAYVVPIAVGVKWFPDKKGLITGLAVAGFGFGATIWVKLADSWWGGLLNTVSIMGLPGVQSVFIIYGIIFTLLILVGSLVMVNPPEDYQVKDMTQPKNNPLGNTNTINYDPNQVLRTPQFYILWITFIFSGLAGLMVIYCIKLFGIDVLRFKGIDNPGLIAGTAMAWYAIFNGVGRIVWGSFSDKIGRKKAIILMTTFQGIILLSTYHIYITSFSGYGLIIAASLIGFNFGGNFTLFPSATADIFGNKNVGSNYAWVFTAYGIAGILGPQIAGYFKDSATNFKDPSIWMTPFIIAGVVCLLGSIVMLFLKKEIK